jgi:energy-coupling factor transport system substrate-specific component
MAIRGNFVLDPPNPIKRADSGAPLKGAAVEVALSALMAAILIAVQAVLAPLPNIELVSTLIILFVLRFGWRRSIVSIYVFAAAEGLIYGFSLWWTAYLYVWLILILLTLPLRKNRSVTLFALMAAGFGLSFGALCEIPWLITAGWRTAVAAWGAGIPFDLIHAAGNFVLTLLLMKPLHRAISKI